MPLFIDNEAQADSAGVWALEQTPARTIDEISLGYVGLVGQFEWGPKQAIDTPDDGVDFLNTFAPAGAPRASSGYYAVMQRRGFTKKIVRVLGSGSAAATATLAGTGGNVTATAKYHGTLGNSIAIAISAATDGTSTKRNITVTLTDAITGTTTEIYENQANTAHAIDVTASKLLASLATTGAITVWPANGSLSAGSNGSAAASSDYLGTPGAADKGLALFENDPDVRVVVVDDCGSSLRAAVNDGLAAHAQLQRDRIAVVQVGEPTDDWATVKAAYDAALKIDRVIPIPGWLGARDDGGVERTTPAATFAATALVNLQPQESHAWRDDSVTKYYAGATRIIAGFSSASRTVRAEAQKLGLCIPVLTGKGKVTFLHDRTGAGTFAVTRRVTDFLALAIVPATDPWTNGPNVAEQNREIKAAIEIFCGQQVDKGRLVAFETDTSMNTALTLGAGLWTIAIKGRSPAPREKILLKFNVGPQVEITTEVQAA